MLFFSFSFYVFAENQQQQNCYTEFRVFIGIYFILFAVTELFMLLKIVSLSHVIMVPAPTFGTRSLNWWQTISKVPESVQSKVIREVGGGGYRCNFLIFDSNKLSLTGILLLLQLQSRRNPHVEEWICSEECWGSKIQNAEVLKYIFGIYINLKFLVSWEVLFSQWWHHMQGTNWVETATVWSVWYICMYHPFTCAHFLSQ